LSLCYTSTPQYAFMPGCSFKSTGTFLPLPLPAKAFTNLSKISGGKFIIYIARIITELSYFQRNRPLSNAVGSTISKSAVCTRNFLLKRGGLGYNIFMHCFFHDWSSFQVYFHQCFTLVFPDTFIELFRNINIY